jgi:hypothetical protein
MLDWTLRWSLAIPWFPDAFEIIPLGRFRRPNVDEDDSEEESDDKNTVMTDDAQGED